MRAQRLVPLVVLALLGRPALASAQKDPFFEALLTFYQSVAGVYGDEGPQLARGLDALSRALAAWDREFAATESQIRAELKKADDQTALRGHTLLASLYIERARYDDALHELDADIRLDPKRAAFPRFKAIVYQAANRPAEAAEAFRSAWLLDPSDVQNAYHLIVHRSPQTTGTEIDAALETLAMAERELLRVEQARTVSPFISVHPINDDVGGLMAFVPAAYAASFDALLKGQFESGMSMLRAAVAADPVVAAPASQSEAGARGIAALRAGNVAAAAQSLEAALTSSPDASEVRRILATAYSVNGDTSKSVEQLREVVRLNPKDERAWLALARGLDAADEVEAAVDMVHSAVKALPDAGALRWLQSLLSARRQRTEDTEIALTAEADRVVLLAGKGEFFGRIAKLAQAHLDYDRAIALLEQRVVLTPNSAAAHRDLGRAYIDQGRDGEAYAELVIAFLLDNADAETVAAIGRFHFDSARYARAAEMFARATKLDPMNVAMRRALGDSLVRAGNAAEGQQRLEEAEQLQTKVFDEQRRQRAAAAVMVWAVRHMADRQYELAIEAWQQVIELQGGNAPNHLRLAQAFINAKRLEQAAEQLRLALAAKAGPEANRRLAEVYAALGRTEESARERQTYVDRRLRELRERSADAGLQTP